MTTTNAELIAEAREFHPKAADPSRYLLLRLAAALESATTVSDEMNRVIEKESRVRYPEFNLDGNRTWSALPRRLAFADGARWAAALTAALTEGERR